MPPGITARGGGLICRRCYRLRHYGRNEGETTAREAAGRQIAKALIPAEAVVAVTEPGDFEGGLPPAGTLPKDKPIILVLNKMDLLPPKSVLREVLDWVRARWQTETGLTPVTVMAVSALRGIGLDKLGREMRKCSGPRRILALVGATSVGKSTLLNELLDDSRSKERTTVSRFPGTTQAANKWYLKGFNLTLFDTPGFSPGDRLLDRLCPACAALLVPERSLTSKMFQLRPEQAVLFGGYAAFNLLGAEPRTVFCYTSDRVPVHRTSTSRVEELLAARPAWLMPRACSVCGPVKGWRAEEISLNAGEDLTLAGLGWFSLRGGPAEIRAVYPEGVRLTRRPALFGPREPT